MDENSLFDKYLRIIDYTFRWSGLHLRNRKDYNVRKARILYCIHFIGLNLNVLGGFWWFVKQASKGESLVSLTYAAPSIALACLCNFKSLSIMLNASYVDKLVYKLRELESKVDLNSIESKILVEEPIKFLHFVLKVSNLFNWLLIVAFPSMPLARTAYNFLAFNKVELEFPFLTEYPFNPYDIKIYPFVLLSHIWGESIALFWIFASQSLYYICATFIIVQFKLLQQEILQIIPENSSNKGRRQNEDEVFQIKVWKVVEWHQEIIEAVKLVDIIYSKSTLFNFVSSSAMICLTGFNVTTIDDLAFVVMFFAFLCLSLVQIFCHCLFGDMLMRSSKEVSDAVYNSKWYLTNAKNAKMLHFLQMRAQKPCKLTAYGYADVNLTAFSKIMNSAWSYFALLKTVNR
ncbi:odorant receptor 67c-like [Hyposmocoma kahamanoa]|uniref:odorant receptor 67c-like n=1 Tax=Hyposmocoma kahamanoa TaxID=1477025 RepID=UPI000E6D8D59|nr:odorant receptor 67c-like [Hyposmocoma kahamanoa]